ncbi:hypothetical protein TH63_13515 [Rufibacter radiotolerans]|uniref:Antitoxin component YwqK of the YwqJK toxin-antitoxin module n=1 Tax=Rufibacter radiotolerans TaxID=1379910 RepID=A0A0H4VKT2_9BACT|nr:hypothetical protein [Rufibacter radiotolerans]AKQ46410.1 hypothetical protein TH63_13515 [Rufibacter radiotolerans]
MNKILLLFCFFLIQTLTCLGQRLTLPELINLCERQGWESVNNSLLNKGWIYHESNKGDSENFSTITWSFNKEHYSNKAQGWFYLYTYKGRPSKLGISVFNKPAYVAIYNGLSAAGFKLTKSSIEDDQVISTYANPSFYLNISTQKREDNDWSDRSLTAYVITIIRKSGIYDPNNGSKVDYYEDGTVKMEYSLKNGNLHGQVNTYHENGKLAKKGTYLNGQGNGSFIEYDEEGTITSKYSMANDELHGLVTIYSDGRKSIEKEFLQGTQTGKYAEYHYSEEDQQLNLKILGFTVDSEKSGKWQTFIFEEGKEVLVETINYKNGQKHGLVEEFVNSDTLEIATYNNGILEGPYKRKISKSLSTSEGEVISSYWDLDASGFYKEGLKSGKWSYFDNDIKVSEGYYTNDKKEGKWINYVLFNPHVGKVLSEETYSRGKKNGVSKRNFLYDLIDDSTDTNIKYYKLIPVLEIATYKDDLKSGPFELKDSTGTLISKGHYLNDNREGIWIESFLDEKADGNGRTYYKGEYKKDKEEGKWLAYKKLDKPLREMTFQEGILNGTYTVFRPNRNPVIKSLYSYNKLTEIVLYDSLGLTPKTKYEIYEEGANSFKYRKMLYEPTTSALLEYWHKKEDGENLDHDTFLSYIFSNKENLTDTTSTYLSGKYFVFNQKGDTLIAGNYHKEKTGLWSYRYPEQNVILESNFVNGEKIDEQFFTLKHQPFSGEFEYIEPETKNKHIIKIKNGLRNGKTTVLDDNNKVVRKENYKAGSIK